MNRAVPGEENWLLHFLSSLFLSDKRWRGAWQSHKEAGRLWRGRNRERDALKLINHTPFPHPLQNLRLSEYCLWARDQQHPALEGSRAFRTFLLILTLVESSQAPVTQGCPYSSSLCGTVRFWFTTCQTPVFLGDHLRERGTQTPRSCQRRCPRLLGHKLSASHTSCSVFTGQFWAKLLHVHSCTAIDHTKIPIATGFGRHV